MRLSDLLVYDNIMIQCHDNPDGDALASGYALYWYLHKHGKSVRLVYAGKFRLKKSNLLLMVDELEIPIEYMSSETVDELKGNMPNLLITVDCQYGEGNVTYIPAREIAIIDHHQIGKGKDIKLSRIVSGLGACATLIYQMLLEEGIDINENETVSTALYYGLLTDTNNFAELSHPLDRNLQDDAHYRNSLIRMFRNANISLEEVKIAGEALMHYTYDEEFHYAIVQARPCDPNILGIISDMILEVDVVRACLVYNITEYGTKLSVRSCVREVKANEMAAYLAEGIGNGGGHLDKAGGFISLVGKEAVDTLNGRMKSYFTDTKIIDVTDYEVNLDGYELYTKLPIEVGYVKGSDVAELDSEVVVRTLEGDQVIRIKEDTYIMIGISGEIYPIAYDKLVDKYELTKQTFTPNFDYDPELIDSKTGNRINLVRRAKMCKSTGKANIYAKELDVRVKIFTLWDRERYYLGRKGDYIAVREDDHKDVYVINRDIFNMTYKKVD